MSVFILQYYNLLSIDLLPLYSKSNIGIFFFKSLLRKTIKRSLPTANMGEGSQAVEVGGRVSGIRGNTGRPPLPTKFVEQISFQEIEEREV